MERELFEYTLNWGFSSQPKLVYRRVFVIMWGTRFTLSGNRWSLHEPWQTVDTRGIYVAHVNNKLILHHHTPPPPPFREKLRPVFNFMVGSTMSAWKLRWLKPGEKPVGLAG